VRGFLVSDSPWIKPGGERIELAAGESRNPVVLDRPLASSGRRSRSGSFSGLLKLMHLSAASAAPETTPSASPTDLATPVTVVDTAKPLVTGASIPPIGSSEIAVFLAEWGALRERRSLHQRTSRSSTIRRGAARSAPLLFLRELRRVVGCPSAPDPAVGEPLRRRDNVFNQKEQLGTIQIRSAQPQSLAVAATCSTRRMPTAHTVPRSLHSARTGARGSPSRSTSPASRKARRCTRTSTFRRPRERELVFHRVLQRDRRFAWISERFDRGVRIESGSLQDRVPEGSVLAVVTNRGMADRFVRDACRPFQRDFWFVADWNRYFGVPGSQTMIIRSREPRLDGTTRTSRPTWP